MKGKIMGNGFWCIMFKGRSITDDIRDALFQQAYLMIRSGTKKKKFRSKEYKCEGVVTTTFKRCLYVTTPGTLFDAVVECETGQVKVQYLMRDSDLQALGESEESAWMLPGENWKDLEPERIRENPIRKVTHSHRSN